jgi:uncharacterized protein
LSLEETVATLTSNLRKMGRSVGIEESVDAANALRIVGTSDRELYSAAINATLIKDFGITLGQEQATRSDTVVRFGAQEQRMEKAVPYPDLNQETRTEKGDRSFEFSIYSPHGIEAAPKSPKISRSEEKRWALGISKFKKTILTQEGHRHKRSIEGQIDPRRTMLLELKKGGDSPAVFRSIKKISKANVVLLCDVSGSMNDSNSTIVNMCCSFKRAIPKSEIFLFSTKLKRITYYASRYSPGELSRRIPRLGLGFGGGTKIGQCLRQFRLAYGNLLTRRTTVVIFSDGWDIGDVSILKHEMIELQNRTNRVIWINPFLGSKNYSVETLGMRTALDFVDDFLSPTELVNV